MPHSHPERGENHEDSLFKGMVVGAVIGAGILWLFGTDQGKKVKKQIENEGEDLLKKVTGNEIEEPDEDIVMEELPPVVRTAPRRKPLLPKATAAKTPPKRFFKKKH